MAPHPFVVCLDKKNMPSDLVEVVTVFQKRYDALLLENERLMTKVNRLVRKIKHRRAYYSSKSRRTTFGDACGDDPLQNERQNLKPSTPN